MTAPMTAPALLALIGPLAIVWALAVATPGPNFFAILTAGLERGRAAAITTALGTVLGAVVWVSAGLFGLAALFRAFPVAETAIRWAGAVFLVWNGLGYWLAASRPDQGGRSGAASFRTGLLTTLTNPKSAAVAASVLAVAIPPTAPTPVFALAAGVLIAVSTIWYLGIVAVLGSHPATRRIYGRARPLLLRLSGTAFIAFGLALPFEK